MSKLRGAALVVVAALGLLFSFPLPGGRPGWVTVLDYLAGMGLGVMAGVAAATRPGRRSGSRQATARALRTVRRAAGRRWTPVTGVQVPVGMPCPAAQVVLIGPAGVFVVGVVEPDADAQAAMQALLAQAGNVTQLLQHSIGGQPWVTALLVEPGSRMPVRTVPLSPSTDFVHAAPRQVRAVVRRYEQRMLAPVPGVVQQQAVAVLQPYRVPVGGAGAGLPE